MAKALPYDPEVGWAICERIANGETLVAVCRDEAMPSVSTVLSSWMEDAGFKQLYARAKEIRLDVMAEEITQLADECRPGEKTERKHISWRCSVCLNDAKWRGNKFVHSLEFDDLCEGAEAEKVTEDKTITADMVERSRLQIDTRKWLLARLAARTYGDKLNVEASGPDGGPIRNTVEVVFVSAKKDGSNGE